VSGSDGAAGLRLDKYLWFARLAKSRSLAQGWVKAGEVAVNGRVIDRSSCVVRVGDVITLPRGPRHRQQIRVLALAERRGAANQAALLYAGPQIRPSD
jgi:ribosome-associated heat shock protein Hsp15